jgi:hypothetical protein
MFLRRIFKGVPDLGPWVSLAELMAALLTLAATLIALGLVPSPFGGAPTGTISGTVTDAKTGMAVPEATVQVTDSTSRVITAESIPDAKGAWKETVKPGSYAVKAVCDGYRPATKTVIVAEKKTRIVRLAIVAEPQGTDQAGSTSTPTETVERVIVSGAPAGGGGGSGGGAPQRASNSEQDAADAASAPSGDNRQVDKLMAEAKKLNNAEKYDQAVDKLTQASNLDPTDGRIYALAVRIRAGQGTNWSDAKDWYNDGVKYAKKYTDQVEQAGDLLK